MRNRTTGEDGDFEFSVIKERKEGRRFIGMLEVILAGKRQGRKLTVTFSEKMNADMPKATVTREW